MNPNQDRTQSRRIPTSQEQEDQQRQEPLESTAFEQRFNFDLEEKLNDYGSLNEYYEQMESMEQVLVQDFERHENAELQQFRHDHCQQLTDIEIFEQEEEMNEKQHDHEMQAQLEQLEQLEESKQILYYEWMQHSESLKKKVTLLEIEFIETSTFP